MERLSNVKCFLLDMDGTFYLGGKLIDGSLSFIERVLETGRDFLFLTNNSSHNARFYVEKLKKMGLEVDRNKILTSGEATAAIVREKYPGKRACWAMSFLWRKCRRRASPSTTRIPKSWSLAMIPRWITAR